jgi:hypothetical protein
VGASDLPPGAEDPAATQRDGTRAGIESETGPDEPTPLAHLLGKDEPGGIDDVDVWLMSAFAMIPMAASVTLILVFHWSTSSTEAIAAAAGLALVFTLSLYGSYLVFHFNAAPHASVDTYNDVCNRMARVLSVKLHASGDDQHDHPSKVSARLGIMETVQAFTLFRKKKGLHWILGKGYLDLLRLVHRSEEALIMCESVDLVMADAAKDRRRLSGANTPQRDDLLTQLHDALHLLEPEMMQVLEELRGKHGNGSTEAPVVSCPAQAPQPQLPSSDREALARQMLKDVRFAVNEFRDASRARLVEARNNLIARLFLTALTTSLLVVFIVAEVDPNFSGVTQGPLAAPDKVSNVVMDGAVLYAVGATVGLLSRLYADLSREKVGGDYGYSHVRLFQTFLVSGLAGVAGVYIGVVLPILGNQLPSPSTPPHADIPSLVEIFNLQTFPAAVLYAAVFGLAPGLVFDRLWGAVDRYRENLQSSEAAPVSASASGANSATSSS